MSIYEEGDVPPAAPASGLSASALDKSRQGVPGQPAATSFTDYILARAGGRTPAEAGSGGGPNGYSTGQVTSRGVLPRGGSNPGTAAHRPVGSFFPGSGVYIPSGFPVGGGAGGGGEAGGAPANGPYLLTVLDARLPNGVLFSPFVIGASAPARRDTLWLDTSSSPSVPRFWNGNGWADLHGPAGPQGSKGDTGDPGPQGPPGADGSGGGGNGGLGTNGYTLPPATTTVLGGIIVGTGLTVTGDGTLSVTGGGGTGGGTGAAGQGFTFRGAWAANTAYNAYDVLTSGGQTYLVPAAFTSGASFDAGPLALWAAKGADGAAGLKGDTGLPGAKGDTGLTGSKGDTGTPGAKGDQGIPGTAGVKGDQGIQGQKGDTGLKGDPGLKGDTGVQGAAATVKDLGAGTTQTNVAELDFAMPATSPSVGVLKVTPMYQGIPSVLVPGMIIDDGLPPTPAIVAVKVKKVSAAASFVLNVDTFLVGDTTSGTFPVKLPDPGLHSGPTLLVGCTGTGGAPVSVITDGTGKTITGSTSVAQGSTREFSAFADGSGWWSH